MERAAQVNQYLLYYIYEITTNMRSAFLLAGLTALAAATPVAVEQRQATRPDPSTVYVESKPTLEPSSHTQSRDSLSTFPSRDSLGPFP